VFVKLISATVNLLSRQVSEIWC